MTNVARGYKAREATKPRAASIPTGSHGHLNYSPWLFQPQSVWPTHQIPDVWFSEDLLELSNRGLDAIEFSNLLNNLELVGDAGISTSPLVIADISQLYDQTTYSHRSVSASSISDEVHCSSGSSHDTAGSTEPSPSNYEDTRSPDQGVEGGQHSAAKTPPLAAGRDKTLLAPHRPQSLQSQPKKFICEDCLEGYNHRKNLREHKQTKHHHLRFQCDFPGCKKSVAQKKNLARHKIAKHGSTSVKR
ncbi:hypothetical protein T440DRAFT_475077 [Plenodomus tracheiphilus IPT5]|uniref:C2H2-type domain-containing protein n=1 Tax=Plenodomus tracheiphilus IPT5 TaxID=1408161 RepID=A0A6A7BJS6_9PLEO|nr:hypothetical protein T440DRAFT_475077 [Plenodomus tracheiphilus IPT5]